MTRILPEKTVELWTAIAVSTSLPQALIWSPTNVRTSSDQLVGRDGKSWAFELKAIDSALPSVPIDLHQLERHAHAPFLGLPVLYVLPIPGLASIPIWGLPLGQPIPPEAAYWPTFGDWAWVLPAGVLASKLGVAAGYATVGGQPRHSHLSLKTVEGWIRGGLPGLTLSTFLMQIRTCVEPAGWVVRRARAFEPEARRDGPANDLTEEARTGFFGGFFLVNVPASTLPGL